MSRSPDSNNLGGDSQSQGYYIPDARNHNRINEGKIADGHRGRKSKAGITQAYQIEPHEAEYLMFEILSRGMVDKEIVNRTYQISYDFCRRLINAILAMAKSNGSKNLHTLMRSAIFDCVWQYYGRSKRMEITKRVDKITQLIERLIEDN